MCILLTYTGCNDKDSDYSFVLASNRDEFYYRPAQNMAHWNEDPNVLGGRDLEPGCDNGTWLAVAPTRRKLGVLLNVPGEKKDNAKSRGKIVADFVKSDVSTSEYVQSMKDYFQQCNEFVFVSVDFGKVSPEIQTYCNATDKLDTWVEPSMGFGNCFPDNPLKKVEAAKNTMEEICTRLNKISMKEKLIEELIEFLRCKEKYLPDSQLEKRQPYMYKQLSSIYVEIPEGKYGTRTHTIVLISKAGHIDVIEVSLQPPIDVSNPNWLRTAYNFDI